MTKRDIIRKLKETLKLKDDIVVIPNRLATWAALDDGVAFIISFFKRLICEIPFNELDLFGRYQISLYTTLICLRIVFWVKVFIILLQK